MKKQGKLSSGKLGFEIGSGLKKSQSKYSYEGICKLYGIKKVEKGGTMKRQETREKLVYWLENLKMGLKYKIRLAKENEDYSPIGREARISVYMEVIEDLDKILEIK